MFKETKDQMSFLALERDRCLRKEGGNARVEVIANVHEALLMGKAGPPALM